MRRICYKISRTIHRYTGLVFLVWFLLLGISGILLNHPDLIRGITIPSSFVPPGFGYRNWNHMALKDAVFSQTGPKALFVCGRLGVWRSPDLGRTFSSMNAGYPSSAFDRETNSLLLVNSGGKRHLLAGNRTGLFMGF